MTSKHTTKCTTRSNHTITLPIGGEEYEEILQDPKRFRSQWLDPCYAEHPELFPKEFERGYEMKGRYHSKRENIDICRIALRNGEQYQIRPCFVLPCMVGRTKDVGTALFLRNFGVPYWALVYLYGQNISYWYRH